MLVADDNADMRDYVRRLLTDRYDVEIVGNGVEALQAVRERRPDLLLSDVMMPALDGFRLLREIRADPQLSSLPIVLLSARAGDDAKVEGLDAGADDYLTKPFSAQELLARVNANITMARLRREIAAEVEVQKTRLQAVLDTVPVAVWFTFDSAGLQVIGNRCAAEMLRMPENGQRFAFRAAGTSATALSRFPGRGGASSRSPAAAASGARRSGEQRRDGAAL